MKLAKPLAWVGIVSALIALPLVALAQVVAEPDSMAEIAQYVMKLMVAIKSGDFPTVAAIGIVLAVAVFRKIGAPRVPIFGTNEGGALLLTMVTIAGAVSAALIAGGPITWALLGGAVLKGTVLAGGMYTIGRRLGRLLWVHTKLRAWVKAQFPFGIGAVVVALLDRLLGSGDAPAAKTAAMRSASTEADTVDEAGGVTVVQDGRGSARAPGTDDASY